MFELANYVEAGLWMAIGLAFGVVAVRHPRAPGTSLSGGGGVTPDNRGAREARPQPTLISLETRRRLSILAAVAFTAFGVSDIVEVQTGAWWRPTWLLVWKAACVLALALLLRAYFQLRAMSKASEITEDAGTLRKPLMLRIARRLLTIVIATVSVGYVLVCLGVAVFQKDLMYFPDRAYALTPSELKLDFETPAIQAVDGVRLAAWFMPRERASAAAIIFHGNGGTMSDSLLTARVLHRAGYAVMTLDYRGYGESEGSPDERGIYADADAAWDFVVGRGFAPERIVLYGRSLGGAVAIELASRRRPGALVVDSTFTSMAEVGQREYPFLPVSLLCTQRFDSISRVGGITCPKLFMHGRDDDLIPIEMARRLYAAAAEPKEMIETEGTHNNSGFERDSVMERRVVEWLKGAMRQ